VVVISGEEDSTIMQKVLSYGAMGFISKNSTAQVTLSALNLVLSGGVYVPPQMLRRQDILDDRDQEQTDRRSIYTNEYGLTRRQMQVLTCMASGLSNKEIAEEVNLAEGTVKIHVAAVYQNLHVSNRMEAVRVAEKLGLLKATHD
jgi:DNA-binding NarL/FixJ family response regulator